jgi:hypothetical protein
MNHVFPQQDHRIDNALYVQEVTMPYQPGEVTKEVNYVFICATCQNERNESGAGAFIQRDAEYNTRQAGWTKTALGWLCGNCKTG